MEEQARGRDNDEKRNELELFARHACVDDLNGFLVIAREWAAEHKRVFHEATARHTFAGLLRGDPVINVLQLGDEIVGFSLIRTGVMPLTGERLIYESLVFVRADFRSAEAEIKLHELAHFLFEDLKPAEGLLLVPPTPHATQVWEALKGAGYCDSELRMATGPVEEPKQDQERRQKLH